MDQTNVITWIGLVIGMIGAISPAIFGLLAIFLTTCFQDTFNGDSDN